VFDNYRANEKFESFWGFSCMINDDFLFDTGSNGRALVTILLYGPSYAFKFIP
jgi:7,8-dihydropterin-6-yl-methyl-4-(beta-D-ribofuranosyl)aminobenzene 5'-phosphate synthase